MGNIAPRWAEIASRAIYAHTVSKTGKREEREGRERERERDRQTDRQTDRQSDIERI